MLRRPQKQASWTHVLSQHRRGTLAIIDMEDLVKTSKPYIRTVPSNSSAKESALTRSPSPASFRTMPLTLWLKTEPFSQSILRSLNLDKGRRHGLQHSPCCHHQGLRMPCSAIFRASLPVLSSLWSMPCRSKAQHRRESPGCGPGSPRSL